MSEKVVFLKLEGAMGTADVWLNGKLLTRHAGGYLPMVLEITSEIQNTNPNLLAIRLNNNDDGTTGPKPLAKLDFNTYGGLYRSAKLIIKNRLHITDPIHANLPASGGVFVTFPTITDDVAVMRVQTHIQNAHDVSKEFSIRTAVIDSSGQQVVAQESEITQLDGSQVATIVQNLKIANPHLWSVDFPYLYTVKTQLFSGNDIHDQEGTQVGIRHIKINKTGCWLNGEKIFLRGTNRHQEYPYIGYALSEDAQFRDAKKIKDAGFDYVRLSHYPHSPAFLDACDELGLLVTNCIMGWQY